MAWTMPEMSRENLPRMMTGPKSRPGMLAVIVAMSERVSPRASRQYRMHSPGT